MSLHIQSSVSIRRGHVRRRDFLKFIPGAAAAAGLLSWQDLLAIDRKLRELGVR